MTFFLLIVFLVCMSFERVKRMGQRVDSSEREKGRGRKDVRKREREKEKERKI